MRDRSWRLAVCASLQLVACLAGGEGSLEPPLQQFSAAQLAVDAELTETRCGADVHPTNGGGCFGGCCMAGCCIGTIWI